MTITKKRTKALVQLKRRYRRNLVISLSVAVHWLKDYHKYNTIFAANNSELKFPFLVGNIPLTLKKCCDNVVTLKINHHYNFTYSICQRLKKSSPAKSSIPAEILRLKS